VKQVLTAKRRIQYHDGLVPFAVVGMVGGWKSSLINDFCGSRNKDIGSGATETTLTMGRYANSYAEYPCVWCDIPGAGTLKIPVKGKQAKKAVDEFEPLDYLIAGAYTRRTRNDAYVAVMKDKNQCN
jgi:hypothetical protein